MIRSARHPRSADAVSRASSRRHASLIQTVRGTEPRAASIAATSSGEHFTSTPTVARAIHAPYAPGRISHSALCARYPARARKYGDGGRHEISAPAADDHVRRCDTRRKLVSLVEVLKGWRGVRRPAFWTRRGASLRASLTGSGRRALALELASRRFRRASVQPRNTQTAQPRGFRAVPPARFERATLGLEVRRSIQLSYGGRADAARTAASAASVHCGGRAPRNTASYLSALEPKSVNMRA